MSSATPDDERLNQLNELQTQHESSSPSVLVGLSGVVNAACESVIGALGAAANSASGSSAEDSFLRAHDVIMLEPLVMWERELSETLFSDDSRRSTSCNRKVHFLTTVLFYCPYLFLMLFPWSWFVETKHLYSV